MTRDQGADAFERAVRDNETALLGYFQRRLLNADDAAEAFGELLLTAWKLHRKMPVDETQARMWFYGVARNVLHTSRRTLTRRSNAVQRLAHEMRSRPVATATDTPLIVREALAKLADEDAELICLVYWDGLASHEAAAVLGLNPSTARSRLSRAKAQLRVALEPTGDAHPPSARYTVAAPTP